MKRRVVHGSARMGDYLIVAMKKSQHVPFQGRLDCPWLLLLQMKNKEIPWRSRTDNNRSILTLCNKRPLLVIVQSCGNMLAIFLPNVVSPSRNTISHIKCLIFCSILTQLAFSQKNCNKISQCKISQMSIHWETDCFMRTD